MTKALVFSDAHIHPHKRSTERLNHCVEALRWVFQTAIDRKIKHVIFGGDLFHDRQKIDVLTYQRTFELFEEFLLEKGEMVTHFEQSVYVPPFQVYLLMGNHDMFHFQKWDISTLNPLRNVEGVWVINKPSVQMVGDQLVGFLPYTHDPIKDVAEVQELWQQEHKIRGLDSTMQKVLVGHVAVDGAVWNVKHGTTSEVTVEHDGDMTTVGPEQFDWWDRVWFGHYHAEQKLNDRVEYIGSPLQLSFGEAFQKKHILIYDFEKKKSEYIKNDFSPQHYIIKQDELDHYDLEGNFVRVVVDDIASSDVLEMQKELLDSKNVGTLEIKQAPKNEEHVVTDAKAILLKEEEMLEKYVEQVDVGELDEKKLLLIGKQICQESDDE
jgi:DNA repair exonuclease SbcCD nuclease subunit